MRALLLLILLASFSYGETWTYWIESCTKPDTGCEPADEQLAVWAFEAWARAGSGGLQFERAPIEKARIRVYWAGASSGLYGEARPIAVNGRRGAELHIRPDLRALGEEIEVTGRKDRLYRESIVYLTCLHELGHALGLPHTQGFNDIMYSFGFGGDIREYFARYRRMLKTRDDIRTASGLSPEDEKRISGLYVKKSVVSPKH